MKPFFALLSLLLAAMSFSCLAHDSVADKEWYVWASDDTQLFVREIGTKVGKNDPIVVLHGGFGAEHSYLIPAIEPLTKKHKFVLYDQRGSLRSPAPAESVTLENFVGDLEQLRKELEVDQLTLLAHSAGAILAYAYLEKYPHRVKKLILFGPAFPFFPGGGPDNALLKEFNLEDPDYIQGLREAYQGNIARNEQRATAQIKLEGLDHEPRNGEERTSKWRIHFASANIHDLSKWREMRGGQAFYESSVSENLIKNAGGLEQWSSKWSGFFSALKAFKGDVTFIVGTSDFIDPRFEFWPLIAQRLPSARLVKICEAGHNIWIDQPQLFTKSVADALKARSVHPTLKRDCAKAKKE